VPPLKDYFDPKKSKDLVEDALKRAKGTGEKPFAFGMGKSGPFLAIDYRDEYTVEKFLKEIKMSEFKDKFIVGTAVINGPMLELKTIEKKGTIKPKEVKEFLKGVKSPVSRAMIDGAGDEPESGPGANAGNAAIAEQRKTMLKEITALNAEVEQLLKELV
jgi:hypothetical protein